MKKILMILLLINFLSGNAQFHKVYNGTSGSFNIGVDKHFKSNLFIGLNSNIDYLIKNKDLDNQFGMHYFSYETSLNFGYGKFSKSYFSYSLGLGYNVNPGKFRDYDEFGYPLGELYRKNSFFISINSNYNIKIYKKLYFAAGISIKRRVEMYDYECSVGCWPDPNWGSFIIPSVNVGVNFVL